MTKKNLERAYDALSNAIVRFEQTTAAMGAKCSRTCWDDVQGDREAVHHRREVLMQAASQAHCRCGEIIPMSFRLCQKADALLADACCL